MCTGIARRLCPGSVSVLRLFSSLALVATLIAMPSEVAAQYSWANLPQCQRASLFWDLEAEGRLDNTDCKPYITSRGLLASDYWDFAVTAGEYVVVTMRPGTMLEPYLEIYDPQFVRVALDDDSRPGSARALFLASTSGVYRAIATSSYPEQRPDLGTYTIRLGRLTTPIVQSFFQPFVLGSQVALGWSAALSPSPILEYLLVVGSAPGASDIGVFSIGPNTQLVASAPPGVYYARVRARNSLGFGDDSIEREIHVGSELSAPRSLRVSIFGRRVTLNWLAPDTGGATYYEVLVGSMPGVTDIGAFVVGNATTLSVDDVPAGVYYVRVRAGSARGPGPVSNELVVLVF